MSVTGHDLPKTRRVRFVCVSDTHNASALTGAFKLPKGDVLVHAGDMSNQGSLSELRRTVEWIEKSDFQAKIVIAENPHDCIQLFMNSPSIVYLNHSAAIIRLLSLDGTEVRFKVFGSPYSPARGRWAFGYTPEQAFGLWDQVPLDTDVLVTHTPPKYHCDESRDRGAAGCEYLRQTLWRVRPRLAICGHVHEARGTQTIRWDLESSNVKYKEHSARHWNDPGTGNKQSLLDLSSRSGAALDNDGSTGNLIRHTGNMTWDTGTARSTPLSQVPDPSLRDNKALSASLEPPDAAYESEDKSQTTMASLQTNWATQVSRMKTLGQGGDPLSGRSDSEALAGRLGRQETCVINAAIMATSWPHNLGGGKRYNKPIVVDIDLPLTPVGMEERPG